MNKPFFSIIFPVYNVARYLGASIESILNQTFKDFEIIAINDGSTDESLDILKSYAKNHSNLKLISQENGGLSDARNAGLSEAQGQYICFVDSDDLLHSNFLDDFYQVISKTHADICKNTNVIKFSSDKIPQVDIQIKNIHQFSPKNLKIGCNVWSFVFKYSLIKEYNLHFITGRIFEDEPFVYMILPLGSNIFTFSGSPYFYRQHSQSIVANAKVAFDRIENFKNIVKWYENHSLLDSFPLPFYILYDVSINNPHYLEYLQASQSALRSLPLTSYLYQDNLANALYHLPLKEFVREHQKSRGKLKYYLRRLFGLL